MASAILEVQYSTSTVWTSEVIRRLCHSAWSHVDIVLPGEGLLGVSGEDKTLNPADPGGVRVRPFDCWPYLHPPLTARIQTTYDVVRKTIEAARSQIGKPFDNGALFGFLTDLGHGNRLPHLVEQVLPHVALSRDWRDPSSWFCSEYVVWSCEMGRLWSWPLAVCKERVSPGDSLLLFNPFMDAANILLFINAVRGVKT